MYSQNKDAAIDLETLGDEIFSLSIEDILNIDVELATGSFLDLDYRHSEATITIIDRYQIHNSGARHLSELLEIFVPGFQYMVNKWNGIIWGMRGVAADRNTKFIFLVNGHKMNHESRDGAMSELDLGMLGDIERVEVLRGPAGLVYGSGAIAGVVNVVTKEVNEGNNQVSGSVRTWSLQSVGGQAEMLVNNEVNEDFGYNVALGMRASQGVGVEKSRIYGKGSWPYPFWESNPPQNGVPTAGASWSTPGNFKIGSSINYKDLKVYSRVTHQVTNASGYFPIDGWPEYPGGVDSTATPRMIDGNIQDPNTSFYAKIRPGSVARRQYVVDNFMVSAEYKIPFGLNEMLITGGYDAVTNQIKREDLKQYVTSFPAERDFVESTFGERRYDLGVNYNIATIKDMKLAIGYQFRLFDIGQDMMGGNSQSEFENWNVVSEVVYMNHAWFGEGYYTINNHFAINAGLRYDLHTRTINHGGFVSPKLALIGKVNESHVLKLIFQSSANNGSADNYEYNRWHFDSQGELSDEWRYEKPLDKPDQAAAVLPPFPSTDVLHSLKPERATSIELASVHELNRKFMVAPSLSYTRIQNLFVWEQSLFRVFNGGEYNVLNFEIEAKYKTKKIDVGVNHAVQKPINTDIDQKITYEVPDWDNENPIVTEVSPGVFHYSPQAKKDENGNDVILTKEIDYIKNTISVDDKNFLNLATHLTKMYIDYSLSSAVTLHTSIRTFWGIRGRTDLFDASPDHPTLDADKKPIVKWNLGLHFTPAEKLWVSLMVYDVLGSKSKPRNALRWQQMAEPSQTDLYMSDLRSYAITIGYDF